MLPIITITVVQPWTPNHGELQTATIWKSNCECKRCSLVMMNTLNAISSKVITFGFKLAGGAAIALPSFFKTKGKVND